MRDPAARRQSPYVAARQKPAYEQQLKAIVNPETEPEVYRALAAQAGDEIHHFAPMKTLDKLYDGLSAAEVDELTAFMNERVGGIGNYIGNLIPIPKDMHQGGIHQFSRAAGRRGSKAQDRGHREARVVRGGRSGTSQGHRQNTTHNTTSAAERHSKE